MDGPIRIRGSPELRASWACPQHCHLSRNPGQPRGFPPIARASRTLVSPFSAGRFSIGGVVAQVALAVLHVVRSKRFHCLTGGRLVCRARGGEQIEQGVLREQLLFRTPRPQLQLDTKMTPCGDQADAIDTSAEFLRREGQRFVTLWGATGTGKTFVMANIIAQLQQPCLILCPNKSLAKQLFERLSAWFRSTIPVDLFTSPYTSFRPATVTTSSSPEEEQEACKYSRQWGVVDAESFQRRVECLNGMKRGERRIVVASSSAMFPCSALEMPEEREEFIRNIGKHLSETIDKLQCGAAKRRLKKMVSRDLEEIRRRGKCSEMGSKYGHLLENQMTLVDFFNKAFDREWSCMLDESHLTIPHLKTAKQSDRSRCKRLVQHGFRLASVLDAKALPLSLDQLIERWPDQVLFASATPGTHSDRILRRFDRQRHLTLKLQQRPTHILDPEIEVRHPCSKRKETMVEMTMEEVKKVRKTGQQCLVACLTKSQAEFVEVISREHGIKGGFIHSGQSFKAREAVIDKFREGRLDMLCAVGLAREGLDFPNVSTVIVLYADGKGFHRTSTALTQLAGRASRNVDGRVIFLARRVTSVMREVMEEFMERRDLQQKYNKQHGHLPTRIHNTTIVQTSDEDQATSNSCGGALRQAYSTDLTTGKSCRGWREPRRPRDYGTGEDLAMSERGWSLAIGQLFQVAPERRVEHVALVGDGIITIPIPNIGPRIASHLLNLFGSLYEVLHHAKTPSLMLCMSVGHQRAKTIRAHVDIITRNWEVLRLFRAFAAKKFRDEDVAKFENLRHDEGKVIPNRWDLYVDAVCGVPRGGRGKFRR